MKPYDPKAACPKCRSQLVETHHRQTSRNREAMVRKCECCGYSWLQLPLDAVPQETADGQ